MDGRYIEGRKAAPADMGDVLVLGFGKSGRAVCTYCLDRLGGRVKSLTVAAGDRDDDAMPVANACMERGDVCIAVDMDAALQHLGDCLGMVAVPMRDEAAADTARPEVTANLDCTKRNPRIEEQACFAVADAIGIAAAPRRKNLDVHT